MMYRTPNPPPVDPGPTWWERHGDDVRDLSKALSGIVAFGLLLALLSAECNREQAVEDAKEAEIQKDPVKDCERFRDKASQNTPMRCMRYFGVAR